jgi:hypothetical protein
VDGEVGKEDGKKEEGGKEYKGDRKPSELL